MNDVPRPRPRHDLAVTVALAAALAWFAVLAVRLNLEKNFAIDEFQYAHASWLVARGDVPYRDFFEVHFPFVYQYGALAWLGSPAAADGLMRLRMLMLPLLGLGVFSVMRLAGAGGRRRDGLIAGVLLLACLPFTVFATEIRPDAAAFMLYAASLAVLTARRWPADLRGFLSGAAFMAALWASQKAWFYGVPVAAAFLVDVLRAARRKTGRPPLVGNPVAFAGGVLAVALPVAGYLTATRSWGPFVQWTVRWAYGHQRNYPALSWTSAFEPFARQYAGYLVLAAAGIAVRWREALKRHDGRRDESRRFDFEILLAASLAAAFVSFYAQRAPYGYSLLPFIGLVCVYAGTGTGAAYECITTRLARRPSPLVAGACLAALLVFVHLRSGMILARASRTSADQRRTLATIGRLTGPDDAVYDNSGSSVARPHAHFYFYTDQVIRQSGDELAREIPPAIERSGAVMVLRDARYKALPEAVRDYVAAHFQSYDGDLMLWGMEFPGPEGGDFLAVKAGTYFLSFPGSKAGDGIPDEVTFRVDGRPADPAGAPLERGRHRVTVEGRDGPFRVLWLPRDGRRWTPRTGPRRFSTIF